MPCTSLRVLVSASSAFSVAALVSLGAPPAKAADVLNMTLSIRDHKFEPATLKVPEGQAVKLTVNNLDDTAEEFESFHLQFEKVIAGKQSAVIRLKPLAKGTYNFFGEYHEDTAQGVVVVE
jgi:plastocyanin